MPWTSQPDPVLRERIREVYRKLCESGETGRQIVAVHQEIIAMLDALIEQRRKRTISTESPFGFAPDVR